MNETTGDIVMEPQRSLFSISGVKVFRATREELRRARHLPGYVYTSPEFEEYEKDRIFMRDWLCVGRVEELPNRGDYMTMRVMGEPVVVARDGNGRINAFANVCRHRGAEVAEGAGNAKEFRCPHHGWSYGLDGGLTEAPCMGDSAAELGNCRLPSLRSAVYRGWLFLTFNDDPPPLSAMLGHFDREFGGFQPEDCRLADKTVVDLDCNWKFAIEHLMDLYHLRAVHGEGIARRNRGDHRCFPFKLLPHGGFSVFLEAARAGGESPFDRMPWLRDQPESLACRGFLAPNLNFAADAGSLRHLVTWPLAPNRCRVIAYTLLPADSLDRPGVAASLSAHADRQRRAIEEDGGMVLRSLQNGVGSRYFDPGPLSRLEGPIHHVINNYLDAMTG